MNRNNNYEERKLNPDDVVVLRKWRKGLVMTDLYGETFCLSDKKYDTEAIFELIVNNTNMHYFKNGNRYLNLDLVKDVKTEIKPGADVFAVKALCENDHVEVFNCANEMETFALKKNILQRKADSEDALEI